DLCFHNAQVGEALPVAGSEGDGPSLPKAKIARPDLLMRFRFGAPDQVKIGSLDRIELGVLELRIGLVPLVSGKIALELRLFEHASMPSEYDRTEISQKPAVPFLGHERVKLRRFQSSLGKIEPPQALELNCR